MDIVSIFLLIPLAAMLILLIYNLVDTIRSKEKTRNNEYDEQRQNLEQEIARKAVEEYKKNQEKTRKK